MVHFTSYEYYTKYVLQFAYKQGSRVEDACVTKLHHLYVHADKCYTSELGGLVVLRRWALQYRPQFYDCHRGFEHRLGNALSHNLLT